MTDPEDRRAVDDVIDALRSAIERGRQAGATGVDLLGSGVGDATERLVRQRVDRSFRVAPAVADPAALTSALEPSGSAASVAGRVGQVGGRLARRSRIARTMSSRSPAGLALRFGPVLVDIVRGNLGSVDATAAHLVARARLAGVEPDPDRVHAAVVQVLTGVDVDPSAPVDHTLLARTWLRDSGGRLLPFGLGKGGGRTPSAAEVVAALGALDVGRLGRR